MLVPFIALTVAVGVFGVFFVTRDLSERAEDALNDDLARRVVEARSFLHERELYALESASYAANLQGMVAAVRARDEAATAQVLESVIALKGELSIAVATGLDGIGIAELRPAAGTHPTSERGGHWRELLFVEEALRSRSGDRTVGTLAGSETPMIAVAAPICAGARACEPVGVALVGIPAATLLSGTASLGGSSEGRALFDANGRLLTGRGIAIAAPRSLPARPVRRSIGSGDEHVVVLYAPFSLRGRPGGTVAIAVPSGPAFAAARNAARRLAITLIAVIFAVALAASLLVRTIVRRVRIVVETNRKLGAGELSARADVPAGDEIGELAAGVNTMADQLQAAVETLELRVDQRTEEIRRLLEQRTQFFASLSHEFRTPLAVILAQADRLDDPRTPSKNGRRAKEITSTIRLSAGQALEIVNDVLDVAKAESDRVALRLETLDVGALLREIKPTIEGLAVAGEIRLELEAPKSLLASADRVRVREIVLNLADNAVKYTPRGGTVRIAAAAEGDWISIAIADTGLGIPHEAGERIFEPFYRVPGTEPMHGRNSSGLGLVLTRRLVEAHGGVIHYHCPFEGGTVFTFTLPAAARSR